MDHCVQVNQYNVNNEMDRCELLVKKKKILDHQNMQNNSRKENLLMGLE